MFKLCLNVLKLLSKRVDRLLQSCFGACDLFFKLSLIFKIRRFKCRLGHVQRTIERHDLRFELKITVSDRSLKFCLRSAKVDLSTSTLVIDKAMAYRQLVADLGRKIIPRLCRVNYYRNLACAMYGDLARIGGDLGYRRITAREGNGTVGTDLAGIQNRSANRHSVGKVGGNRLRLLDDLADRQHVEHASLLIFTDSVSHCDNICRAKSNDGDSSIGVNRCNALVGAVIIDHATLCRALHGKGKAFIALILADRIGFKVEILERKLLLSANDGACIKRV